MFFYTQAKAPRRGVFTLIAVFILPVAMAHAQAAAPFAPPSADDVVLYRDATLIEDGASRANMDVLVAGERIRAVYADSAATPEPALAAHARIVDLHGLYLMPGLVDSHVHMATPPNQRQAAAMLRRDLYGGVTTVRDMADDLRAVGELTRESRIGEIAAPDIFYAALMAGPDFFSDPRTAQTSAGGVLGHVPWMQAVSPDTDLPIAVAMAHGTYATAIKLYADLTPDMARRITAEAHRQGMLVWAHATLFPAAPSDVVGAGVDAISHACLLTREGPTPAPTWANAHSRADLRPFQSGHNPALARLFTEMVRRGTVLDATIWVYGPPPPGSNATAPTSCDERTGGIITEQAYRAGVAISAGTDNVSPYTDAWPELFHELDAMHTLAHMPVAAILRSATLVGARATGQERDIGGIAPGKLANMIVLERNPLESLANLQSLRMTIKRGRVFMRRDFAPLVAADITDF